MLIQIGIFQSSYLPSPPSVSILSRHKNSQRCTLMKLRLKYSKTLSHMKWNTNIVGKTKKTGEPEWRKMTVEVQLRLRPLQLHLIRISWTSRKPTGRAYLSQITPTILYLRLKMRSLWVTPMHSIGNRKRHRKTSNFKIHSFRCKNQPY